LKTGLSPKHVKRLLAEIEIIGLIRRVMVGRRRPAIEVTWTPSWEGPSSPPEASPHPIVPGTSADHEVDLATVVDVWHRLPRSVRETVVDEAKRTSRLHQIRSRR
jgi:hypothetical protein